MLRRTLVAGLISVSVLLLASSVSATQVSGTSAILAWTDASGPVSGYAVYESRNGGGFSSTPTKLVSGPSARIQGTNGDVVFVRVAAVDSSGRVGPLSPTSESVRFVSSSGGGGNGSGGGGSDEDDEDEEDERDRDDEDEERDREDEDDDDEDREDEERDRDDEDDDDDRANREPEDDEEERQERNRGALGSVDLDENGTEDMIFFEEESGEVVAWLMRGEDRIGTQSLGTQNDEDLIPVDMSDFDGDGKSDILWHDPVQGTNEAWLMKRTRPSVRSLPPNGAEGWKMAGCGDFNRDGVTDVIWTNPKSGATSIWYMNRSANVSHRSFGAGGPAGAQLAGVGDLDGDSLPDLIWKNGSSVEWWKMNGANPVAVSSLPSVGTSDQLAQVADFDGDGRDDLVWSSTRRNKKKRGKRRTTHYLNVWYTNGLNAPAVNLATASTSRYEVTGVSDIDADGKPEIAIRTAAGETWGAEVERRQVVNVGKKRKGKRRRRSTAWAVNWVATDGATPAKWKLLTP